MEKVAIIELNESALKLSIFKVNNGKSSLCLYKDQAFQIGKEIDAGELLSPKTKGEVLNILKIYRKIIESYAVSKIISVSNNVILRARNYRGFFDEIYNNTGINFTILPDDEYIKYLFNGVVNSIDNAKGVFIYVGAYTSYVVKYNRRAILGSTIIPYGTYNLDETGSKDLDQLLKTAKEKFSVGGVLNEVDQDCKVVAVGSSLIALGKVAKKIQRYSLNVDNNYQLTDDVMDKSFNFIKGLDLEKIKKIKGIGSEDADKLASCVAIVKTFLDILPVNEFTISTADLRSGILCQSVLNCSQERFNDLLSNALDNYYEFNNDEFSINHSVYNMALILFKQLKVMHKLPRFYVKPLRIAAFMYDGGKSINEENYTKYSVEKIVFSGLNGATHRELLIAGFIALCQNLDDFSLNDWIKYKDILTDEDLDAVRKLGIIVKLAVALNASRNSCIQDIVCDILGDSIIMKTIVEGDASFEILEGMKVAQDYKKVYKKSLQII